ncbi:MAG: RluA family pseudouridine synthase [Oscillospiraceae bacterium]|nr:RluA family pseudouridine synthase [Oscillospiraceae bacterium]
MKEFLINENDAGQRLDRFIKKAAPLLPPSLMQRYIRIKRIKVNGKRAENAYMLALGDTVQLYNNDEFFPPESDSKLSFMAARGKLNVVYEDENILLADKEPGLVVHEDESGDIDTLIGRIQRYLYEKKEYDPNAENSFAPALCNRIDRNTGGIVIAAKNAASLRVLNELIKERLIDKFYLCVIHGKVSPSAGTYKSFMLKDERQKMVRVFDSPKPGAKTAITKYKTLKTNDRFSLMEIELLTGRFHQIRAQFAYVGHPLLGDTKYGTAKQNKDTGFKFQALYSYKLRFSAGEKAEHLAYLNGKEFVVKDVPFLSLFK